MPIPIYKSEAESGLAEAIQSSASIAYEAEVKPFKLEKEFENIFDQSAANLIHPELAKANDNDQWDLFWINSVLVSIGWNKNDDVFDPGETWAARHTPVHKQFNFMHDEKDIIGSMTASIVLGPDGKVIASDTETVPTAFDIVVASVIYTQWSDPELQERMNKIIAGIQNNEWFVSMECLFRNFDYAVVTPEGEHKVIARTDASSFLTKHLRIYGGEGNYEGHRIGRLLRNFTFSGKGLVDNPANPKSIIFSKDVDPFVATHAETTNFSITIPVKEKTNMSDVNADFVAQLKTELAEAKARNEKLVSKVDESIADAQKAERDRLENVIATHKVDIEDLEKKVAAQVEVKTEDDKTIAELQKSLKDSEAKIADLEGQVKAIQLEKNKATRISQLVEVGASSDEAASIADRWAEASDEQFADVVELNKSKFNFDKKDDKDNKDKKDDKDAKASDSDDNEANADADLDNAEGEDDVNLAAASSDSGEALRASASAWIGSLLSSAKTEE